ncbi:putative hemolysin [Vibrio sp. WZ-1]|jgi:putative hemolysin|uniref:putative hemolysin n=1 Tax=Vibrio TaxID=662 RepID=UPI003F827F8D
MKKTTIVTAVAAAIVLAGCSTYEGATRSNEYASAANPAAVYCVQQGGELETVTENGERVTYCLLSENERVEQWEYFRKNHKQEDES